MNDSFTLRVSPRQFVGNPGLIVGIFIFLLVLVSALSGGSYSAESSSYLGIFVWATVLIIVAFGSFKMPSISRFGWITIGSLISLIVLSGASIGWSSSPERGLIETIRLISALGTLVLGLAICGSGYLSFAFSGMVLAILTVCLLAVSSRIVPGIFDQATSLQTALGTSRLAWPIGYWNSLGTLSGLGLLGCLAMGLRSKSAVEHGLWFGLIPIAGTALLLTLSRGAIVSTGFGLLVLAIATRDRHIAMSTLFKSGLGLLFALLLVVAFHLNNFPSDGSILALVLLILSATASGVISWRFPSRASERSPTSYPVSQRLLTGVSLLSAAIIVGALLISSGGSVAALLDGFKAPLKDATQQNLDSISRLGSISGSQRYEVWSTAVEAAKSHPFKGLGTGSWESWWTHHRNINQYMRNAHSQPLEVAAELGVGGCALFLLFVMSPFIAFVNSRRLKTPRRAVYSGFLAVGISSLFFDWNWQIGTISFSLCLVVAVFLTSDRSRITRLTAGRSVLLGAVSSAAIILCSIGLIAPRAVERSQHLASVGNTTGASDAAAEGARLAPFAVTPLLQLANLRFELGDARNSALAALAVTRREPKNWRGWYLLARARALQGKNVEAIKAFKRARELNPRSGVLFLPGTDRQKVLRRMQMRSLSARRSLLRDSPAVK